MTEKNPQHVDRDGLIDILQREAIVLVPYPDGKFLQGPRKGEIKWSQGPGSQVNYNDDPPREVRGDDRPITINEAVEWLKKSVAKREVIINRKLTIPITQHQFNALHSIYYQFGTEALDRIAGLFNESKTWEAILAFAEFPFGQNRKQTSGHSKRRISEIAMAAFGYYDDQDKIPLFETEPYLIPSSRRFISASDLEL